jgi:starvation-inducible DNA-binding protein
LDIRRFCTVIAPRMASHVEAESSKRRQISERLRSSFTHIQTNPKADRSRPDGDAMELSGTGKSMVNGADHAPHEDGNGGPAWGADNGHGTAKIVATLNTLLADVFTLYVKTKNFHWHMSGPHFRDYHALLDEQAAQLLATTDAIAERVRKVGGGTLRSIQHIARLARLSGNEADFVTPSLMLAELRSDNAQLAGFMRDAHFVCGGVDDVASMGVLESWIDEAERRVWFLFECDAGHERRGTSTITNRRTP